CFWASRRSWKKVCRSPSAWFARVWPALRTSVTIGSSYMVRVLCPHEFFRGTNNRGLAPTGGIHGHETAAYLRVGNVGAVPRQQVVKLISAGKGKMRGVRECLARQRQLGHVHCGETFNSGRGFQDRKAGQDFQSPARWFGVALAGF